MRAKILPAGPRQGPGISDGLMKIIIEKNIYRKHKTSSGDVSSGILRGIAPVPKTSLLKETSSPLARRTTGIRMYRFSYENTGIVITLKLPQIMA